MRSIYKFGKWTTKGDIRYEAGAGGILLFT